MLNLLNPEDLRRSAYGNVDPWRILHNHYHLGNELIKAMLRPILRKAWPIVEYYLTNPRIILDEVSRKDASIASDPVVVRYLNRACKKVYDRLYRYTWM